MSKNAAAAASTAVTYASVVSQPKPLDGQKNRSSGDFQFKSLPSGNLTVTFSGNPAANSILCVVMKDRKFGTDPIITELTQGMALAPDVFETGTNYYIAAPKNAGEQEFTVTFSG
ncbi:hypothetical protein P2318_20000 [Myxococcaceae bacterium GXIMD 01537]